jgi:hypothetical protein
MRKLLTLIAAGSALLTLAQPANDQCSDVTPFNLSVGGTVERSGTRTGATTVNDGVPGSSLMTTPGAASVWEAFTTTECSNVTALFCGTALPATTMWNFLTPDCPADSVIYFSFANYGILCSNGQFGIQWFNLPPGTYYMPIYCTTDGGDYTVEFSAAACIPGPPNDACSGATPLDVHATCIGTPGSVANATPSVPADSCNGFIGDANDDVWFSFVATGTEHTITMEPDGDGLDAVMELYGGDCDAPVLLDCADATTDGGTESITATGLEVDATYRFRVFHYYTNLAIDPGFSVCVTGDIGTGIQGPGQAGLTITPSLTDGPVTIAGTRPGATVRVLDHLGRLVMAGRASGSRHDIDLSTRPAGPYIIQVIGLDGTVQHATVVRH